MGNASSLEEEDPFDGIDTLGYRVLGVQPDSPAAECGLVSFLDFLVGANQKMLLGSGEELEEGEEYDDVDLPQLLEEFKNKELELLVYNIKSEESRLVKITPRDNWGGAGLLGVTIRLDNYAGAVERLVRVLEMEDNSPAHIAGLVPFRDYLLGTTHCSLDSPDTLSALLQEYQDRVLDLYVYNTDSDIVRTVALMPTLSWGGQGMLGAQVGVGYLHRLPHASRQTEGASVLRKVVRYLPEQRRAPNDTKNENSTGALIELEPQLEMEASEDESSDRNDEDHVVRETSLSTIQVETVSEDELRRDEQVAAVVFNSTPPS